MYLNFNKTNNSYKKEKLSDKLPWAQQIKNNLLTIIAIVGSKRFSVVPMKDVRTSLFLVILK